MGEVFQGSGLELKTQLSHKKQVGLRVNVQQLLIGLFFLFLGTVFYYLFRPAEHIYFFKFFSINPSTKILLPSLFATIGDSLPTFMHVIAFSLMTAAFIGLQKRGYAIVCLFWFAIDVLFEIGQGLDSSVIQIIPNWFMDIPFLENTKNYFRHGRFDWLDLLSIAFGSLVAYLLIIKTMEKRGNYEK